MEDELKRKRLLTCWKNMRSRCTHSSDAGYKNYGGRGIQIEWKSFEEFYADMSKSYILGLSIERKDFNGNYSKSNCTWIPIEDQPKNTRRNRHFVFNGIKYTMHEMADHLGINYMTFAGRIRKGMSIHEIAANPPKPLPVGLTRRRTLSQFPSARTARLKKA